MRIQFKQWDGKGDPHDPRTGALMGATTESLFAMLRGKVVSGVGGVSEGSESFMISFHDGPDIWFVTDGGPVRVLLYKHS